MNNSLKFFLDFIFPIECVRCGAGNEYLCEYCFSKIVYNDFQICPLCGKRIKLGYSCLCAVKNYVDIYITFINLKENRFILSLVHQLKYNFIEDIAYDLAIIYKRFWQENEIKNNILRHIFKEDAILTSVPLHRRRLLWRGFNQSDLIIENIANLKSEFLPPHLETAAVFAAGVARGGDLSLISDNYNNKILKRTKNTEFQAKTKLSENERKLNMENAFICLDPEAVKNKTIILFDDVITTGTTMEKCAKVLKESGAKRVIAMAVGKG